MTASEFANKLIGEPIREDQKAGRSVDLFSPRQDSTSPKSQRSGNEIDPKIKVLADRMALQIFSVPSLQSCLADYAVVNTHKPDGSVKIQMDFLKLPKEILPELEKLLSVDFFKNHRLVKYIKNGHARTGLEIEVIPKELPGDAFDYAT